jgi:hypothetical protein
LGNFCEIFFDVAFYFGMGGDFKFVDIVCIFLNVDTQDGTTSKTWGVGVAIRAKNKTMQDFTPKLYKLLDCKV